MRVGLSRFVGWVARCASARLLGVACASGATRDTLATAKVPQSPGVCGIYMSGLDSSGSSGAGFAFESRCNICRNIQSRIPVW